MKSAQILLVVLSTLSGGLVDLHSYRKSVNLARQANIPPPPFDVLCMVIDLFQGASAGVMAAMALNKVL